MFYRCLDTSNSLFFCGIFMYFLSEVFNPTIATSMHTICAKINLSKSLMMPLVRVWSKPNGFPMAKTFCPTCNLLELPLSSGATCGRSLHFSTARSPVVEHVPKRLESEKSLGMMCQPVTSRQLYMVWWCLMMFFAMPRSKGNVMSYQFSWTQVDPSRLVQKEAQKESKRRNLHSRNAFKWPKTNTTMN